jgi:hypothetical protein
MTMNTVSKANPAESLALICVANDDAAQEAWRGRAGFSFAMTPVAM